MIKNYQVNLSQQFFQQNNQKGYRCQRFCCCRTNQAKAKYYGNRAISQWYERSWNLKQPLNYQMRKCENALYRSFSFSQHCVGAKTAFPTLRGPFRAPPKALNEWAPVCLAVLCRDEDPSPPQLQGSRRMTADTLHRIRLQDFGWSLGPF